MTKKCLQSFIAYCVLSAVFLVGMYVMLLFDVNKYVGVGIGGGALVVAIVLYIVFRKKLKKSRRVLLFLPLNGLSCGIAASSLYVYMGEAPKLVYSLAVFGAFVVLFAIYCILASLSIFKRFPRICLISYCVIILSGIIVGMIFSSTTVFSLALLMFVLFASFLATILISSADSNEHSKNLVLVSFIGLFIIVIVVLIVISEGDGLDGFGGSGDGANKKPRNQNPYDFNAEL